MRTAQATSAAFHVPIRFSYEAGGEGERVSPFRTEWRRLPDGLVERSEGGDWLLELEGQAPLRVRDGEALVVPRGVLHRLRMTGARRMRTAWMLVNFDRLAGLDILTAAKVPYVLPGGAGERLGNLMATARACEPAAGRGDIRAAAQLHRVGFEILEVLTAHAGTPHLAPVDPDLERLVPALQYVETHLHAAFCTADLARLACLSPSRFHAVFKRVFGLAPIAYVLKARLRLAQRLLVTTSLPVGTVAERTGFASPYYFSRAFHRHLHLTPTAFRLQPSLYREAKGPGCETALPP